MKYKINTLLTRFFFLFVFVWVAMTHFTDQEAGAQEDSTANIETESLELHSIMRLLLIDIHTINEGIYTQNFDLIKQGAENINNHAPLAPESRQLLQETLGERMAQFGAYDKIVHDTADSLRQAVTNKDMGRVREYYHIIEQGCVSCHASFQEEIKTERLTRD